MLMLPDSGFCAPVMRAKIVDLPAPFWPMMVIFEPLRTEKSASSRMGILWPYSNVTESNRSTVSFAIYRTVIIHDFSHEQSSDDAEPRIAARPNRVMPIASSLPGEHALQRVASLSCGTSISSTSNLLFLPCVHYTLHRAASTAPRAPELARRSEMEDNVSND
jgi:hypothetical protein